MTDELDRAEEEIEMELAESLRKRKPRGPTPTGVCLYCDEPLPTGKRWCDRECEAGWEYEQERKAVNRSE